MQYTPPVGGAPNDPYVDANPGAGIEGSAVPAAALEAPQREVVGVITAAGLTPDPANTAQLLAAIQELIQVGAGTYALDTGAANAYVIALAPAIVAYQNGLQVRFKVLHGNTGASTLNAGGGAVALVDDDGNALTAGELPTGAIATATYDQVAGHFYLTNVSSVVSTSNLVLAGGTSGGTANAQTVTCTPTAPGTGNPTSPQMIAFKVGAGLTNTGAVTLKADSQTAKAIVKRAPNGLVALASGELQAGNEYLVWYDGTQYVLLTPSYTTAIGARGAVSNFAMSNVGAGTPNTQMIITADDAVLRDAIGNFITVSGVNVTVSSAAAGVNGLDTGALAASTPYAFWLVYNPSTGTLGAIMSLSFTAPTLPPGYTFAAYVSQAPLDPSKNFYRVKIVGKRGQFVVTPATNTASEPLIASGAIGSISTPTYVSSSLAALLGPRAAKGVFTLANGSAGNTVMMAAPNGNYGAYGTATVFAVVATGTSGGNQALNFEMVLESLAIYLASTGSTGSGCSLSGWEDF